MRGTGRPVLLLHGWPGFSWDWRRILADTEHGLDGRYTLVAPDFRGFGESGLPDGPPDQVSGERILAEDVSELLASLDLGAAVVVGTDIGSAVAQRLVRDRPHQVAGLVLCNPSHPHLSEIARDRVMAQDGWYQRFHLQPWCADIVTGAPHGVRTYLRHFLTHWTGSETPFSETDTEQLYAMFERPGALERSLAWYRSRIPERSALAKDPRQRSPLSVPTEILWGEEDPVSPPGFAEGLERSFTDFALTTLPGVGHFVPAEAPQAVLGALARVSGRAA